MHMGLFVEPMRVVGPWRIGLQSTMFLRVFFFPYPTCFNTVCDRGTWKCLVGGGGGAEVDEVLSFATRKERIASAGRARFNDGLPSAVGCGLTMHCLLVVLAG